MASQEPGKKKKLKLFTYFNLNKNKDGSEELHNPQFNYFNKTQKLKNGEQTMLV